jgi:hypothetical protein
MNEGMWALDTAQQPSTLNLHVSDIDDVSPFIDHSDALAFYLEHFGQKKASPKNCKMISVDRNAMEIEVVGESKSSQSVREVFHIPFDPPLADAREARPRLIHMMYEAIEALGMVSLL